MIEMHARLPQLMQRLAFGITQAFTEALGSLGDSAGFYVVVQEGQKVVHQTVLQGAE